LHVVPWLYNDHISIFTACVGKDDDSDVSAGDAIPFTKSRSEYGVDISDVKTFTYSTPGLYHISVSIRSKTNHAYYAIRQNAYTIAYGYTAEAVSYNLNHKFV
jgi:hypothetical protein